MTDSFSAKTSDQVLATDLDGTLIPLAGDRQNEADLQTLAQAFRNNGTSLVFVTGRHFASVATAIDELQLPSPDWIICDVGTSIYERVESGEFSPVDAYQKHLQRIVAETSVRELRQLLGSIEEMRAQEPEKQGRFKLSFYVNASQIGRLVERVQAELDKTKAPYSIIHSVDPFNGDGLIDLVPAQASKASALEWWADHTKLHPDAIVFAGDSGNDLAALTAGHRAIVVANADDHVIRQAAKAHQEAGWQDRLFVARGRATSGVLEGCRWFKLL